MEPIFSIINKTSFMPRIKIENKKERFGVKLLAFGAIVFLPAVAFAATTGYVPLESSVTGGQNVANFGDYLKRVYEIGITVTIVLAVLYLVIGGFGYITSSASLTKKEDSKTMINNALFGLALALLSYIILNTISPQFTQFSLNISEVGKKFNAVQPTSGGDYTTSGGVLVTKVPTKNGVCPDGGCKASPEFVSKAQAFYTDVKAAGISGQFTEIGSYSYQGHSDPCHSASPPTCGDFNFNNGVTPNVKNINAVIDAAQKSGGRAVYEVGTQAEANKLVGVKNIIVVPPKKDGTPSITAPHFSFYSI